MASVLAAEVRSLNWYFCASNVAKPHWQMEKGFPINVLHLKQISQLKQMEIMPLLDLELKEEVWVGRYWFLVWAHCTEMYTYDL